MYDKNSHLDHFQERSGRFGRKPIFDRVSKIVIRKCPGKRRQSKRKIASKLRVRVILYLLPSL